MFSPRWLTHLAVFTLTTLAVTGCGGPAGPKRVTVQGTVNLDKKPLEKGVIYFKTTQTGAVDTLDVVNGEFKGEAEEGARRVEIVSYQTKVVGSGAMKGEVQENLIPRQYNLDSKLSATVTAGGPNQFAFDLAAR